MPSFLEVIIISKLFVIRIVEILLINVLLSRAYFFFFLFFSFIYSALSVIDAENRKDGLQGINVAEQKN